MDHGRALENNKPLVVDTWVVKSLFGRVMVVWLLGALPLFCESQQRLTGG
jgi:hypothetical protein